MACKVTCCKSRAAGANLEEKHVIRVSRFAVHIPQRVYALHLGTFSCVHV